MLELLTQASPLGGLVVVGFSCLFVAVTSRYVASLLPSRVMSLLERFHARLDEFDRRIDGVEGLAAELRGQWAVALENLEQLDEAVRRRQRRAAASESRLRASEAQEDAAPATFEDALAGERARLGVGRYQ